MAPEVLLRQNHSFCADYFAVGVIAYELTLGKRPYQGRDRKQIREEMLAREVKIQSSYRGISQEGIDFINKVVIFVKLDDSKTFQETFRLQRNRRDHKPSMAKNESKRISIICRT